jgi:UPF0755 protein
MSEQIEKSGRSWLKITGILLGIILVIGGAIGAYGYHLVYGKNIIVQKDYVLTIPTQIKTVEQLSKLLEQEGLLTSTMEFNLIANQMNYKVKQGKYAIPTNIATYRHLVRTLKGNQLAIKVTFHNFRVKEQLAGYLSQKIPTDSLEVARLLNDEAFLATYGYTPQTIMAMFIPNTYEVYWNYTPKDFFDRMQKEHKRFWNQERLEKAAALELTPTEVYTLASIVECESQYKPERPRIAGVYLNRLQKPGWKLEADPTVVYAVGDFSIKRVLNVHLETDSPYNTYKYDGLPPGPIYMASISSIDAVLDHEKHDYMFFCAKPPAEGAPSTHAFAKSLNQHLRNAKKYWQWLRTQR